MLESKVKRLRDYYEKQGFTERQIKNRLKKEELKEEEERNQNPVDEIVINIEWRKSSTWGNCPRAEALVKYADGTYKTLDGYRASGCGYDKESTVIAEIFNDTLKYELWKKEGEEIDIKSVPYGIRLSFDFSPYYEGGVGTSCYYRISDFIGGKFENISSGRTFDVYKFSRVKEVV